MPRPGRRETEKGEAERAGEAASEGRVGVEGAEEAGEDDGVPDVASSACRRRTCE